MKTFSLVLLLATVAISRGQNITSGLVALYTFEGTPNDVSGNGNNATPAGNYQYLGTGLLGSGLRISGDNSLFIAGGGHVILPAFNTSMNAGFTLSLWAKDEVLGGDPVNEEAYIWFGILDQPVTGITLNSVTKQVMFFLNGPSGTVGKNITKGLNFSTDLALWKHLVLTYTPGKIVAYYNGAKIGEESITVNVFPASRAGLGRHWWSGGSGSSARMSVTLDNVRIYNRALSDADVQTLYSTDLAGIPAPVIASQSSVQTFTEGDSTTFSVSATSSLPVTYQWLKDGVAIAGATNTTFELKALKTGDSGSYAVRAISGAGTTTTPVSSVTVNAAIQLGRFINLSTLGNGTIVSGFVVGGSTPRNVLVRAVGPALRLFGVTDAAPQTTLTLYAGTVVLGLNSGWNTASNASQISAFTGTFPLANGSGDSALMTTLAPGNYSAKATGNGTVLLEVYEVP